MGKRILALMLSALVLAGISACRASIPEDWRGIDSDTGDALLEEFDDSAKLVSWTGEAREIDLNFDISAFGEFYMEEFPDVTFRVTRTKSGLYAYESSENSKDYIPKNDELILLYRVIQNMYLADLTGDGLPEICATVSGVELNMADDRAFVYDYANKTSYELSEHGVYNYKFKLEDKELLLAKYPYSYGALKDYPDYYVGTPEIINNELIITNLVSRKHPDLEGKPLFEGGAPAIPEDLTEVERELYDTVYKLNAHINSFEMDVFNNVRYNTSGNGVGWDALKRYCDDLALTYERALERGLITEEYQEDGYYQNCISVADLEEIYYGIFSREAQDLYFDINAGLGQVIYDKNGEAYFEIGIHGHEQCDVVLLLNSRVEDDEIIMTFASGAMWDSRKFEYIYEDVGRDIIGYAVGELKYTEDGMYNYYDDYTFYYYPDLADDFVKVDYTFIKEDGVYKIKSITLNSAGNEDVDYTEYDLWRKLALNCDEREVTVWGREVFGEYVNGEYVIPENGVSENFYSGYIGWDARNEFIWWLDDLINGAEIIAWNKDMRASMNSPKLQLDFKVETGGGGGRYIFYVTDYKTVYILDNAKYYKTDYVEFPFNEFVTDYSAGMEYVYE